MMETLSELRETVQDLVRLNKEGVYWDFKQKHHSEAQDLLHDIICLANAEHPSDRYIIYGITDNTGQVTGVTGNTPRRTQAHILDLFKSNQNKFAGSKYPDISLETLSIDNAAIDVLIIKDRPYKPYYLVESYKQVRAYHIYSRVHDTNTPRDKSAAPHDIERMWRERFGLDLSSLQRVQMYLTDFKDWECGRQENGNALWHHKHFPEFTIRVTDCEKYIDSNQEWTRGEVQSDNNSSCYYDIYFHQTRLARILWVSFDDHKKSMVAPKWEPRLNGRFYYHEAESLEHAMQLFHLSTTDSSDSSTVRIRTSCLTESLIKLLPAGSKTLEIPVVHKSDVGTFLSSEPVRSTDKICTDGEEQYRIFLENHFSFSKWVNA